MGLDRIDYANTGVTGIANLTPKARKFLDEIDLATAVPIEFAGTGFRTSDVASVRTPDRSANLCHA